MRKRDQSKATPKNVALRLPESINPNLRFEVIEVGALVPAHTARESGHFEVQHRVRTTDGTEDIIQIPLAYLPQTRRGTIWHGGIMIDEIAGESAELTIDFSSAAQTLVTGADIVSYHFVRHGSQFVLPEIEVASNRTLSRFALPEFIRCSFVRIQVGSMDYYFPSDVIFRECFYHSDVLANEILAGELCSPKSRLYHPEQSGWRGEDFEIVLRYRTSRREEKAIARLICHERGINALTGIRAALQRQINAVGQAYIRATFPLHGTAVLYVEGQRHLGANGYFFLVTSIWETLVPDRWRKLILRRPHREKWTGKPSENSAQRIVLSPPPRIDGIQYLTADSRSEAKSRQETAAIKQAESLSTYLSRDADTEIIYDDRSKAAGTWERKVEPPTPINETFSTAKHGTTQDGLPRASQIAQPGESDAADLIISDNPIGQRFGEMVRILRRQRNLEFSFPCPKEEIAAAIGDSTWGRIELPDGTVKSREFYVLVIERAWKRSNARPCLLLDFERSAAERAPHPFYIVFAEIPTSTSPREWALGYLKILIRGCGRLDRADIPLHQIRDQNEPDWNRHGWGKGKSAHNAYKVAGTIRKFWRDNLPSALHDNAIEIQSSSAESSD